MAVVVPMIFLPASASKQIFSGNSIKSFQSFSVWFQLSAVDSRIPWRTSSCCIGLMFKDNFLTASFPICIVLFFFTCLFHHHHFRFKWFQVNNYCCGVFYFHSFICFIFFPGTFH